MPVLVDLSNLSDLVKNDVVKKTDYNAIITKIENKIPDVSNLATKNALNTVEDKIPNVSWLATKTTLTAVKNKIPDIGNFATKTALTNLSNTVPDISTLIKRRDYDTKIAETENKYVSYTGFDTKIALSNVITKRNFAAKLKKMVYKII